MKKKKINHKRYRTQRCVRVCVRICVGLQWLVLSSRAWTRVACKLKYRKCKKILTTTHVWLWRGDDCADRRGCVYYTLEKHTSILRQWAQLASRVYALRGLAYRYVVFSDSFDKAINFKKMLLLPDTLRVRVNWNLFFAQLHKS